MTPNDHIGTVSGHHATVVAGPTLSTHATYVANDFVGTDNAAFAIAGAARVSGGSGYIISTLLIDDVLASVAGELWLFKSAPAGLGADSAAFTITDADALLVIGVIPFSTYYASALNSVSPDNTIIPFTCPDGATSLYGAFVTRGAPGYNAASVIHFTFQIIQN